MRSKAHPPRFGIIADDLTGATDAAAAFARQGFSAAVALHGRSLKSVDTVVLALSTDSRHDTPAAARRKVVRACTRLRHARRQLLFKKIDSTVQGNIVAEAEAFRDSGGFESVLFCPANPAQGRTVRGGILRVRGGRTVPLVDLCRAQGLDGPALLGNPITRARLDQMLGEDFGFIVADACREADLARLVRVAMSLSRRLLPVGSAAMAAALAGELKARLHVSPLLRPGRPRTTEAREKRPGTLILAGSSNPVTERQLAALNSQGMAATIPWARQARRLAEATLGAGQNVVIRIPVNQRPDATVLGGLRRLLPLFHDGRPGSLIVTGGDTADLLCRCLRPRAIIIRGEIVPGLAWGHFLGGHADGLPVATKPGGFGRDASLVHAVRFLATASIP